VNLLKKITHLLAHSSLSEYTAYCRLAIIPHAEKDLILKIIGFYTQEFISGTHRLSSTNFLLVKYMKQKRQIIRNGTRFDYRGPLINTLHITFLPDYSKGPSSTAAMQLQLD
jgi:hypothetical protein